MTQSNVVPIVDEELAQLRLLQDKHGELLVFKLDGQRFAFKKSGVMEWRQILDLVAETKISEAANLTINDTRVYPESHVYESFVKRWPASTLQMFNKLQEFNGARLELHVEKL